MSWANSVLPMYMSGSGCVIPGIFSDFHFDIQVGDTRHRSESIAAHGFQRLNLSFNRTVVDLHRDSVGSRKQSWHRSSVASFLHGYTRLVQSAWRRNS